MITQEIIEQRFGGMPTDRKASAIIQTLVSEMETVSIIDAVNFIVRTNKTTIWYKLGLTIMRAELDRRTDSSCRLGTKST